MTDASPRFVTVAGGYRLAVVAGGDAADPRPPVLLVPGVLLPAAFWPRHRPTALHDGRRWASLSLPGHHPSTLPDGTTPADLTLDTFAACLDDAARALWGDARYVAAGYSTGGFAALCAGALRPERVAGVLAVSAFLDGRWGGLLGLQQRLARGGRLGGALFRMAGRVAPASRRVYGGLFRAHARSPVDAARLDATLDDVLPAIRRADQGALRTFFAAVRGLDLTPDVGRIVAPTLVVHGGRDLVPLRQARTMARDIPGADLVVLDGVGHLFFAEAWDAFDAAASPFLDALV